MITLEQLEEEKANRARRFNVLKSAYLEAANENFSQECVVTDISKTGMRVLLDNAERIPDHVTVVLKCSNAAYKCSIAWRTHQEAGVRILD